MDSLFFFEGRSKLPQARAHPTGPEEENDLSIPTAWRMICCQKLDDFGPSQMPSYAKGSWGSCPGKLQNGRRDPLLRAAGKRTPPGAGA
nr:uncharacterized protein LOC741483 isoform X1 [Pan troglodytes]